MAKTCALAVCDRRAVRVLWAQTQGYPRLEYEFCDVHADEYERKGYKPTTPRQPDTPPEPPAQGLLDLGDGV